MDTPEYDELYNIEQDVRSIGPAPYLAKVASKKEKAEGEGDEGAGETELEDSEALWDFIDTRGRKGWNLQRYKGLGELNPEQLWETTLDPNARVMLQVRLDDGLDRPDLQHPNGHQVEPRRDFIEQNALNVKNLDI